MGIKFLEENEWKGSIDYEICELLIKVEWIWSFPVQNCIKLIASFPTLGTTMFQFMMISF